MHQEGERRAFPTKIYAESQGLWDRDLQSFLNSGLKFLSGATTKCGDCKKKKKKKINRNRFLNAQQLKINSKSKSDESEVFLAERTCGIT